MLWDIFASYEFEQIRAVFEDMGTEEPEQIWKGLLLLVQDFTGAVGLQAFTSDGDPGMLLEGERPPSGVGIRATVQRALRTGHRERTDRIFAYPIVHRQSVNGVVAMELVEGEPNPRQERRLDQVFFFAGMFLAAIKGSECDERIRRVLADCRQAAEDDEIPEPLPGIITNSAVMTPVLKRAHMFANESGVVLITGEPGVGKDCLARAIHEISERRTEVFHEINIPEKSETLFEAELYGVAAGAATDTKAREGHFLAAGKGTVLLNEIGDTPYHQQAKLLRVLDHHEFSQVGSSKAEKCRARIIAATNKDLGKLVREGRFRPDLYDRLNYLNITVPPLREHREDIPRLVRHFASRRPRARVTSGAMAVFVQHDWPGNVRELGQKTDKLLVLGGGTITEKAAREELAQAPQEGQRRSTQAEHLERARRVSAMDALIRRHGDKEKAAADLDISIRGLEKQIARFGLPTNFGPEDGCELKFADP